MKGKAWSGLWREPLLHFLLLGMALFAADAWWSGRGVGGSMGSDGRIVVTEARVRALAQNFGRTWQRAPTAGELDGLIEEHIRDEVLTREAQRLGLDRDDTVIRRRLRQKLEIIIEESAANETVSDMQLEEYLKTHAEVFRGEAKLAFEQVFFDPARRGERLPADIERARTALVAAGLAQRRLTSADLAKWGDALFVLQPSYPLSPQRAIAASFGQEFAQSLVQLPEDQQKRWIGPIESGYGVHLVRLTQREPGAVLPLAQVRPLVEREWRNARRVAVREERYQALRAGYAITVKRDSPQ